MTVEAPALFPRTGASCGYCHRELVAVQRAGRTLYECPPCVELLRGVRTIEGWALFQWTQAQEARRAGRLR